MKLSIANHGTKKDLIVDRQKETHDGKTSEKTSIKLIQKSMMVNMSPIKISARDKKKEVKEVRLTQENKMCRFILKKLEEKKYPFPDFDVPNMLENLLLKMVIELPECQHLEEMGRVNDPIYYH